MERGKQNKKYTVCCDMRGMLSFLILFLLSKKEMHGKEIADELERRRGNRPSPGTIYPALKCLEEDGFIHEKKEGKLINYSLTSKGKETLKISKRRFCKIFIGINR